MNCQKLHIILMNRSLAWLRLSSLLHSFYQQPSHQDVNWKALFEPFWQRHDLTPLSFYLNVANMASLLPHNGAREGNEFPSILDNLKPDSDKTICKWLLAGLNMDGLRNLKQFLKQNGFLDRFAVRCTVIAEPPEMVLRQRWLLGWKTYDHAYMASVVGAQDGFCRYKTIYAAVSDMFGDEACEIIEYMSCQDDAQALTALARALEPAWTHDKGCAQPDFPRSPQALDVHHALYGFPFSRQLTFAHSRDAFFATLSHVEKNEGLEEFSGAPLTSAKMLVKSLEEENCVEKGSEKTWLFQIRPDLNQYEDCPDFTPPLTVAAARPFIAAFSDQFRFAFLRYFRDLTTALTPEQHAVASALEDYRVARQWHQDFFFPRHEPLLSVLTMTRNHSKYITDCMESVSAQAIDFPMEHIIVDDCSDDGTQDIIDNYASQHAHVRPIYLDSRSGKGKNIRALFNACHSRYAALCDGDDYFIDPEKLKTQVDFLNANPDFAISFHPVLTIFENNENMPFVFPGPVNLPRGLRESYYLADLARGNFIQTNSVVYRWRFRAGLPDWFRSDICPSDWYWHLLHAETGKIHFIKIVMSVYRRHASAFYNHAFVDQRSHFQDHGMGELKTYDALDKHFQGRYHKHFAHLANGVFSNFVQIKLDGGDGSLLDDAVAKYPEFGLNFLKNLKTVNKKYPRIPRQN